MDGLQMSSITGAGSAAAQKVASALAPRSAASQTTGATAKASTTSDTSSSTSSGATISGNDFLTLLVSELKNQDPTQPTDPGAYVQQLVGVNSLQQLIEINKGVSSLGTPSTTSS